MRQPATLLALFGAAAAQTTVVTILLPQFDSQPLVASVVGVAPTATTFSLSCPSSADANVCGIGSQGPTIVNGPSTWEMHFTQAGPAESAL